MRLRLEIDLDRLPTDPGGEAARILRSWADVVERADLATPARHELRGSSQAVVGTLEVDPVPAGDADQERKALLHRYLRASRRALLWKLEGLGERDARWPRTPTGTNLLGLVKHVATVEAEYFGAVFARPFPEELPWAAEDAEDNADMWAGPEETTASVLALAERAWAHCDATIEALGLDATGHVPWWGPQGEDVTLHTVLVHVAVEVARHAGHADVLRELHDGRSGLREGGTNLPDRDERWWSDYLAGLQRVAEEAGARES
ncbi:DUF664 domain-containing protein [Auraticoccus sp. F435]|uniref:DUF664 domain-containing protein n=1 Tax=Auraticoccus cholistanensis TaxID=2656650 RepID=A0A6A9UVV0_9ACTN|nr:DinB family protein [Auraticoccus cholistanensis]MVA76818.1 DUF664 domain-containing protein [Auraticoccus cholistanensis]